MNRYIFISMMVAFSQVQPVKAQSMDSLQQLKNYSFPVYFSSGEQTRAEATAIHIEQAMAYYQDLFSFKPTVLLLVLSPQDWKIYTTEPVVYGMPHYDEKNKRLIVAAEDNPFWKSFLPPLQQLPEHLRKPVQSVYSSNHGDLTAQAFFDLLAIHELGHAFHMQGALTMQRNWMGELFVNIFLHTYIAEKEPGLLPALTLFPRIVVDAGAKKFKYTSLYDIHEHYNEIAQEYPENYGWYQCRWHSAAATIYDESGKVLISKLWNAFKAKKEILSDEHLIHFLETNVDKSIASVIENWDGTVIK